MTHINTHVFLSPPLFLHLEDLSPLGVAHERKKICFNSEKKKSDPKLFHLFSSAQKRTHSHTLFSTQIHIWNIILKILEFFFCLFHAFLKHFPGNIFPAGFSHEKNLGIFFFFSSPENCFPLTWNNFRSPELFSTFGVTHGILFVLKNHFHSVREIFPQNILCWNIFHVWKYLFQILLQNIFHKKRFYFLTVSHRNV